jgi:plastocyanin
MRRLPALLVIIAAAAGAAALVAGASGTAGGSATVSIRHQRAHCHTWSVNGGAFRAAQSLTMARGSTITFIDDDVMPHRLVELAGPAVTMRNGSTMPMGGRMHRPAAPGLMNHMGASTTVTLAAPGVYRFRTRAGEDYMAGIATTGEDNVLTLRVTVR